MTICVPKKPFELALDCFLFVLINSWIGLVGLIIYGIIFNNIYAIAIGVSSFYLPLIFWLPWFISINEEKHWIKWCDDKQPNLREEKQ